MCYNVPIMNDKLSEDRIGRLKGILQKGGVGIFDEDVERFLSSVSSQKALAFLRDCQKDAEFIGAYGKWLFSGKDHIIEGLDKSKFCAYIISGTTASFHDFYQIHHNRRLKIRRGEYPYHKKFFDSTNRKWGWIEDEGVGPDDFVILSFPFAGNGSAALRPAEEILSLCNKHNTPVLLDCVFWGLSTPCFLSLKQYPCVKIVSFSLSKFFNVGRLRIGLMYSQYKKEAGAAVLAPYHYINGWSAYIGRELIRRFPLSYMNQKYRGLQREVCQSLDISVSDTLLFGMGGNEERWGDFSRDGVFYRISLSQALSAEYTKRVSSRS